MRILSALFILFAFVPLCAQELSGPKADTDEILANIKAFSAAVMEGDGQAIGLMYAEDASIFPNNLDIITGRTEVQAYWDQPGGINIPYHRITPVEIKVWEDEAYDYGYYEGTSLTENGDEVRWKGKYVIVWKKVNGEWLIYLDIWNRIAE